MRPGPVAIAFVLGCFLLAACGDDDDEAKTSAPLTKAAFITQGDAICERSNAAFERLFETDFPVTKGAIPAFFTKATTAIGDQVNGLRALEEPTADKARIDKLLASGDRALADFRRASSDATFGAEIFSEEGGKNAVAFDKQARAYGFKECGSEDDDEDEDEPAVDRSAFSASKKAYLAEADAICRKGNASFSKLEARYLTSFPPEVDTWAKFLPAIVDVARPQLAELEQLTPPAADKERIDALLARQKSVIDQFDAAGKAAASGDEDAFLKVGRPMFNDSEQVDGDLRAYGFRECGAEDD